MGGMASTPDPGLSIHNHPPRELPGPRLLHELVCCDSQGTPLAVDYLDPAGSRRTLTYPQLHQQSTRLANRIGHALRANKGEAQPVIPLLIPQCPELYVAQLAILKAGGAFCPLNLDAPKERINFILDDVQASVVLLDPSLSSRIPAFKDSPARTVLTVEPILPEDHHEAGDIGSIDTPYWNPQPSDLAYVLYTSGSTGTPKGVGVPHISATQSLMAHDRHIPEFSRFLQFAAPTFDVSVFEVFFPFYRGKTLVACNRPDMLNDLPRVIRDMDVDGCELTPTVAGSLLRARSNAPKLKLLLTIGEMLTQAVISEFGGNEEKESMLWAMYGPTEAAIHCTLKPAFKTDSCVGNIGIPLDTVSIFVIEPPGEGNSEVKIVPVGEVGELAVGGHQLSRGYINRPDQNAAAFLDTPYGTIYRTGDKARLHQDGLLECLGRFSDGQVKLRGQRIELAEIEQAALRAPGCHSAVASVINNILVLFCAVDDECLQDADANIMTSCRKWLPSFMVPGDISVSTEFPRLPSGKVDRKLLKAEYLHGQERYHAQPEEFKDEFHRCLHDTAQNLLGSELSSDSPLSMSGMDSLVAIRFASALRTEGWNVGAVDVLACKNLLAIHTRLSSLCKHSSDTLPITEEPTPPQIVELETHYAHLVSYSGDVLSLGDCTPMQSSMLSISSNNPQCYTNWIELEFPTTTSPKSIETWFTTLADASDILRSGFTQSPSGFKRIVWKALHPDQIQTTAQFSIDVVSDDHDSWILRPLRIQVRETATGTRVMIHIHHALYDGWSFDILLSDLCSLASGGEATSGRPSFDSVVRHHATAGMESSLCLEFWTTYLHGHEVTSTPRLRHTPTTGFGRTEVVVRTLSTPQALVEKSLASLGIHPQAVFQAALSLVWAGILGSDDVLITSVTSGRTIPVAGIEDIIGPCLSPLPLRIRPSQSRTVRDFLEGLHRNNRDVLYHAAINPAKLKALLRGQPGASLFDIFFVYQQSLFSDAKDTGCVKEIDRRDFIDAKLLVEVEPMKGDYVLRGTFPDDWVEVSLVEMILGQMDALVSLMVQNVEVDLRKIQSSLANQFPAMSNTQPAVLEVPRSLVDTFQDAVLRCPEKGALSVVGEDDKVQSLDFRGLNLQANRLARHLRSEAPSDTEIVAIVMGKTVELYTGILAILKAGYAYLPVLPETPIERTHDMFRNSGVKICLVNGELPEHLSLAEEFTMMDVMNVINDSTISSEDLNILIQPSDPAYLIYTSGTTGTPKGVLVSHKNIVSNLTMLNSIYPKGDKSAMLQSCSQAFDVSVFEIFWTWMNGMRLCSATNDILFSNLEDIINRLEVSHLSMTPTVASLIDRKNVPGVQFLVTAGEPLSASVFNKWRDILYQGYGPCETTNICTALPMDDISHPQYIGGPLSNTSAFVMGQDSTMLVPIGAVDELVFGGDQIAIGYINMPDLTQQKFIHHPEHGRLYRTGDLGRMLPGGGILISGRLDGQVKLRGQRIELAEIDSTAVDSTIVCSAATVLVTIPGTESQQLATFYVVATDGETGAQEVKQDILKHIRSCLPSYMVPSYLVPTSQLPSTPAGKIDRARLVSSFISLSEDDIAAASTAMEEHDVDDGDRTPTEILITEAVATALGTGAESIHRWTPLASLGLDSITAISVARELSDKLHSGKKIPVSLVLRNPCVGYLAQALLPQDDDGENTTTPITATTGEERVARTTPKSTATTQVFDATFISNITTVFFKASRAVETVLPCTPLQEAMLTSSSPNHMVFTLRIPPSQMEGYWNVMRQRHPILRTCFVVTEHEKFTIAQVVISSISELEGFKWQYYDTDDIPLGECLEQHEASLARPVDSLQPPVSLAIVRHGELELLSFVCHHALYDGVAIGRLLEEIELLAQGRELAFPPPLFDTFLGEALELPEGTDEFWGEHFAGFGVRSFPRARHTPSQLLAPGDKEKHTQSQVFSAILPFHQEDLAQNLRALGISLLSLAEAAWAVTMGVFTHSEDVCFGNVVNGRSVAMEGMEELVAPCFNTIPVRTNFKEMEQYIELLRHFQTLNPEMLRYQFTPLRRVQALCSRGGQHLFDTLLLVQQQHRELDATVWELRSDEGKMDVPLVCEVVPGNAGLGVKIHHDTSLLSTEAVGRVFEVFKLASTTALRFPSSRIHRAESLPAALASGIESLDLLQSENAEMAVSDTTLAEDDGWTPTELKVREILVKFATCPAGKVARKTTIYQLGLDSISAVQIAAALRREGFAVVSAIDVIEHPSCLLLSERIVGTTREIDGPAASATNTSATAKGKTSALVKLDNDLSKYIPEGLSTPTLEACRPCTPLQEGLLTGFVSSGGRAYFNRVSLRHNKTSASPIQSIQLVQAWIAAASTHPMLRTGFTPIDHPKYSYSMLRYSTGAKPVSVKLLTCGFDIEKWFSDVQSRVLDSLEEPPWEVAIIAPPEEEGGETVTHLAIHHALYDAYSLDLILQDVATLLRGDKTSLIPIEPALSELHQLVEPTEEAKGFWKGLSNQLVVNKFPVLTPVVVKSRTTRTATQSITGLQDLHDAASRANTTIQVAMQAAWARILSSYLGEQSVVFGVVLSGRTSEVMANTSFPCVSTLPVVASNKKSNSELLDAMMAYNTSLHRHQYSRLSNVQAWLGDGGTALFDTIVAYQKLPFQDHGADTPFEVVDEHADSEYAISLELLPGMGIDHDTLGLQLTFFDDVVPLEAANLIVDQFVAVFVDMIQNPLGNEDDLHPSHSSVFSISPPEHPLLEPEHGEQFLHQFVETSAFKHPDKIALQFVHSLSTDDQGAQQETYTYKALNETGNRVANLLAAQAVSPGEIIAVCFDKCPQAYFSILGILKAGCSFVALDPSAPAERKEFILTDSGSSLLLCAATADLIFVSPIPAISVSPTTLKTYPTTPPTLSRPLTPEDRTYCLYTSGTTGVPKGCELTHTNAVQAMLSFSHLFSAHCPPSSKWLQFASFHFDVSVLEQYFTWLSGLTLVAAPRDLVLQDLAGAINELGITHIDLTPSLARLVTPADVPSLCKGIFITGGESLRQEILDEWGDEGVVYNAYGPTEATIGVTMYPRVPANGRSSNIGKQFLNVGSYVLRPGADIPVLRGGVGELCVSGPLVGKGYIGRPDLTKERFPTLEGWGERVYRTGDLVRILHDGCFDFIGRADDQVKLRGQRLEIGEIDHVIKSVPDIADVATVVGRTGGSGKDVLVSFVVTRPSTPSSPRSSERSDAPLDVVYDDDTAGLVQKVLAACRNKLPGYMVPTYVLQLNAIPLSSNNKAEVKTLKKLFTDIGREKLIELSATPQAQSGPASKTLKGVLVVLNELGVVDGVDVPPQTTIFDLGIDSISVLRVARALKNRGFEGAVPSTLLRNPVLGDLADVLEKDYAGVVLEDGGILEVQNRVKATSRRDQGLAHQALGVGDAEEVEYILPCSPLQQGMISRSLEGTAGHYYNTFKFQLSSRIDVERLHAAWGSVVGACSILRTRFILGSDGHVQVAVKKSQVWKGEYVLPVQEDESRAVDMFLEGLRQSWVNKNKEHILEPIQVRIFTIGVERRRIMALNIFHGLYDGASLEMMLRHLATEYSGQIPDYGPSLSDVMAHGPLKTFSSTKEFWEGQLSGASLESIPIMTQKPTAAAVSIRRTINYTAIETAGKQLAVTHQAIIQGLWASVLKTILPSSVTIGIVLSGRSLDVEGVENTIAPLFNTLPFHCPISGDDTWKSIIRKCHEFNTATLPFQHVPLRDIQKWCSGGKRLFDNLFAFQRETPATGGVGVPWEEVEVEALQADHPLAFEATVMLDGGLRVVVVAQGNVADEVALGSLLDQFEAAVDSIGSNVDAGVSGGGGVSLGPATPQVSSSRAAWKDRLGGQSPESASTADFEWTPTASTLRDEIASLGNVPIEQVSPTTSVLELGLDSIDVIKLSARLKASGIVISNSQFLRDLTIARLVSNLPSLSSSSSPSSLPLPPTSLPNPDEPSLNTESSALSALSSRLRSHLLSCDHFLDNISDILPSTPLQEAMLAEIIATDFTNYFNHDVLLISPEVDLDRLEQAWETVIRDSPILRTVFFPVESPEYDFSFAQGVVEPGEWRVRRCVVGGEGAIAGFVEEARDEARRGGGASGLVDVTILDGDWVMEDGEGRKKEKRFLVLSIAHALYDGWSLGLLHRDVESAYNGTYEKRKGYEAFLAGILESKGDTAKAFWEEYLKGVKPTILQPTGTGEEGSSVGVVHRQEALSSFSAERLKQFCRSRGVTVQTLGQAVWASVLAAHAKRLEVVFGTVLSGRSTDEEGELMFPAMNTVAVRVFLGGDGRGLLGDVQGGMAGIREWEHFPLRMAQKVSRAEGALFNTLFMMQRGSSGGEEGSRTGLKLMESVESSAEVEYPVCVEMEVVGGEVVWRVACRGEYFDESGTNGLLGEIEDTMRFFVDGDGGEEVVRFEDGKARICGSPGFEVGSKGDDVTMTELGAMMEDKGSVSSRTEKEDGDDIEWSETELAFRGVLARVSGTSEKSIKRNHSIYNLGLDSISGLKVVALLKKVGIRLAVRDMLGAGSVTEMAKAAKVIQHSVVPDTMSPPLQQDVLLPLTEAPKNVLESEVEAAVNPTALLKVGFDASIFNSVLPATSLQVHMLSAWQNSQGGIFFPEFKFRLSGATTSPATVGDAFKILVKECGILNTTLVATQSSVVPVLQVIPKDTSLDVKTTDAGEVVLEMKPGLGLPGLLKVTLAEEKNDGGGSVLMKMKIHHALYDAVTLPKLVSRLGELVDTTKTTTISSPPYLSRPWSNFVNQQFTTPALAARESFWMTYLAGASHVSPRFGASPSNPSQHSPESSKPRTYLFQLAALPSVVGLKSFCSERGITVQSLFFASYAHVLVSSDTETVGEKDVVIGVYLANRSAPTSDEEDSTEGGSMAYYPNLNLVPLRVQGPGALSSSPGSVTESLVKAAKKVQSDLREISDPVNAVVGLWEIDAWTGVRVGSFVNFLSFAGENEGDLDEGKAEEDEVVVKDLTGHDWAEGSDVEDDKAPTSSSGGDRTEKEEDKEEKMDEYLSPSIRENRVRGVYEDAIDIEVAIRSNALDMGVFGPGDKIDDTGARELVRQVLELLGQVSESE